MPAATACRAGRAASGAKKAFVAFARQHFFTQKVLARLPSQLRLAVIPNATVEIAVLVEAASQRQRHNGGEAGPSPKIK